MNEIKNILTFQCRHNSKLGNNIQIILKRELKKNGKKIKNIKLYYIKYHNLQKNYTYNKNEKIQINIRKSIIIMMNIVKIIITNTLIFNIYIKIIITKLKI